jgi:hypothetical protein
MPTSGTPQGDTRQPLSTGHRRVRVTTNITTTVTPATIASCVRVWATAPTRRTIVEHHNMIGKPGQRSTRHAVRHQLPQRMHWSKTCCRRTFISLPARAPVTISCRKTNALFHSTCPVDTRSSTPSHASMSAPKVEPTDRSGRSSPTERLVGRCCIERSAHSSRPHPPRRDAPQQPRMPGCHGFPRGLWSLLCCCEPWRGRPWAQCNSARGVDALQLLCGVEHGYRVKTLH